MTKLSILKHRAQLFSNRVEELTVLRDDALKNVSENYNTDKCLEKITNIERDYEDAKSELRLGVEEALSEAIDDMRAKVEGKATATATNESMSDITLLQLLGTITETELRLYVDKYKDYPMILNYLKQIGEKNGYHVSFKSIDDAKKIIENLEKDTRDFLENYDSKSDNYKHRLMTTELGANYFDIVGQDLERFIGNNKVTITRMTLLS